MNRDAYIAAAQYDPASLSRVNVPDAEFTNFDGLSKRSLLDHYAVSMLIMILFMGSVIIGATSYYNERKMKTLNRINVSLMSAGKVYLGKIIDSLFSGAIQCASLMLSSVFLFGASYCSDVTGNLLLIAMIFSVLVAVNAAGMLIGMFFKKISPTPLLAGVLWAMLFVSGIFTKEIYMEGVSDLMPTYQVQQAAFDLTMFGRNEKALTVIAVSFGLVFVFILLGAVKVKFRRKSA